MLKFWRKKITFKTARPWFFLSPEFKTNKASFLTSTFPLFLVCAVSQGCPYLCWNGCSERITDHCYQTSPLLKSSHCSDWLRMSWQKRNPNLQSFSVQNHVCVLSTSTFTGKKWPSEPQLRETTECLNLYRNNEENGLVWLSTPERCTMSRMSVCHSPC